MLFQMYYYMKIQAAMVCISCETGFVCVVKDHRYNGLRGICFSCGNNWPES